MIALAALAHCVFPLLFPKLHLFYFAPYLAYLLKSHPLEKALRFALIPALFLELSVTETPFGRLTIVIILALLATRPFIQLFFLDRFYSLSLYTSLFSVFFALFSWLFIDPIPFTSKSFVSELIFMPLVDGVYAFFWFTCPLKLVNLFKVWQKKRA